MAPSDDGLESRVAAARWLRETRERHGFNTAAQFAEAIGAKPYQLSNWETGRSTVDDKTAKRIAAALDMSVIEVRRNLGLWVPDEDEPLPPLPTDTAELRAELRRIAEASDDLSEQTRRVLARLDEQREREQDEGRDVG